ncbi:MAG: nucleotidyltransferase family protein [Blautia massiliensis (ex Durand et al. 2017)]
MPGFSQKGAWLSDSALDLPLHYKLLLESEETLKMYPELSDARIRRILKSRNQYEGFSQFADLLKTRDITRSAICRSLVRIFLDQKTTAPGHIPYARVLGFQKTALRFSARSRKTPQSR